MGVDLLEEDLGVRDFRADIDLLLLLVVVWIVWSGRGVTAGDGLGGSRVEVDDEVDLRGVDLDDGVEEWG